MVSRLILKLVLKGEESTKRCCFKDHMVNFPVLSHGYSLGISAYERAVIQI